MQTQSLHNQILYNIALHCKQRIHDYIHRSDIVVYCLHGYTFTYYRNSCFHFYPGTNCEIDSDTERCTGSTDSICKHGGTCRNFLNGGFDCSCPNPYEFDGPFCEVRTRNFPPKSFMMFWSLSQRVRLQLSVR